MAIPAPAGDGEDGEEVADMSGLLESIFGTAHPVIGVVHLLPLPGSPRWGGSLDRVLDRAVKDGTFREDLYYRINVIPVRLPPLRERIEDLPVLVDFFLKRYSGRFHKDVRGIAESTLQMLSHYWWPGNIRELAKKIKK